MKKKVYNKMVSALEEQTHAVRLELEDIQEKLWVLETLEKHIDEAISILQNDIEIEEETK